MSFILDALKKSENERQRTIGPSLADAPIRRAQTERPWWVFAIGALLVVNLGVLIVALTRHSAPPPAVVRAAPAAPSSQRVPATVAPQPSARLAAPRVASSNPAVRSLAEEADAGYASGYEDGASAADAPVYEPDQSDIAAAANVPEGPPMVRPIAPPTVAPLPNSSNNATPTDAGTSDSLPTASSLIAGGTQLPDMRLDIHVYSNTPTERFVFINMRKYAEGQVIAEGATLERVTPDGAVLNYQGTRFLLPRQ
jgi:general secretion pathway protein B